MTHVSLFSGIGGLDLAAEWAGFETVLFCERDPYCQKVLRKHWPDVPIIEDIRSVTSESIDRPVDVISGGFPCQPFSHAGKRRGEADDRFLWPEMLRVIREIKPRFVVAENVPGLLSIDGGMVFERVLSEMESIGYEVLPLHYPACGVGALHKRDRVFIVANAIGRGREQDGKRGGLEGIRGDGKNNAMSIAKPDTRPDVADADDSRRSCGWKDTGMGVEQVDKREANRSTWQRDNQWAVEPDVGGSFDGFPLWLYRCVGRGLSYGESKRRAEVLRKLWNDNVSKTLRKTIRGFDRFQQAQVLFSFVRQYEEDINEARLLVEGKEVSEGFLRGLRGESQTGSASHRPNEREQSSGEHPDSMQLLPRFLALNGSATWAGNGWEDATPRVATGRKNRVDRLRALGNAVVPQQAYPIFKALREKLGIRS